MKEAQLLSVALSTVPTMVVVMIGVLINNARMGDLRSDLISRITDLRSDLTARISDTGMSCGLRWQRITGNFS